MVKEIGLLTIGDKVYKVVKVAGLEIYSTPSKYMIIFILTAERPEITFQRVTRARINGSDTEVYEYRFIHNVAPDVVLNVTVAVATFPLALRDHLLFFTPLEDGVVYAIPLKACAWYVAAPLNLLTAMHD